MKKKNTFAESKMKKLPVGPKFGSAKFNNARVGANRPGKRG
jgi:hypothetical protein